MLTATQKILRIRKLVVQYNSTNSKIKKNTIAILITMLGGL